MADYFLVLDAAQFAQQIQPALAASWKQRSFEPCRALCTALLPAARTYADRYHTSADESLVSQVLGGLSFDRTFWRALIGDVLLFAAVEMPEFQTCEETLVKLLAPGCDPSAPRPRLPPIVQAHRGSRDLTFGAVVYRPDYVGFNNREDVARLAEYLASVRPDEWTTGGLVGVNEEDAADEIDFAREWFPVLADLFRRVRDAGQVVIHERIY
jgi:hypothetical protein